MASRKPKLFSWTISGVGGRRTVIAPTEERARALAMEVRWGRPDGTYASGYKGLGLYIEAVEQVKANASS